MLKKNTYTHTHTHTHTHTQDEIYVELPKKIILSNFKRNEWKRNEKHSDMYDFNELSLKEYNIIISYDKKLQEIKYFAKLNLCDDCVTDRGKWFATKTEKLH